MHHSNKQYIAPGIVYGIIVAAAIAIWVNGTWVPNQCMRFVFIVCSCGLIGGGLLVVLWMFHVGARDWSTRRCTKILVPVLLGGIAVTTLVLFAVLGAVFWNDQCFGWIFIGMVAAIVAGLVPTLAAWGISRACLRKPEPVPTADGFPGDF